MNVAELIEQLQKIDNKKHPVYVIGNQGHLRPACSVEYEVDYDNDIPIILVC